MRAERAFLTDIVESAEMVQRFVSGRSWDDFQSDELLQEGVLRRLGIIGEAASKLSESTRSVITGVPWKEVIRMRNVLVHICFGVELRIAWDTATNDLQPLIDAVQAHLKISGEEGAATPQP